MDLIWANGEVEYFWKVGLNRADQIDPLEQIPLCAQAA
jgi:hypothetical protein